MMKWLVCAGMAVFMATVGNVYAQKPGPVLVTEEGIDLEGQSFAFKIKEKKGVPTVNNFSFYIGNIGDTDAPNSRIEFWLSDNPVFNADADPMDPNGTPDILIHTQSLGKVKSGKVKKRTVGGGHLKKLGITELTDKYFIAVIDADGSLLEANEDNNEFVGQIFN